MKALILNLLIWIISLAFSQESTWKKSPINKIKYSVFNQMTFRQPVVFTPFDIKLGYLYYGRKKYWTQLPYNLSDITIMDSPILLDSTQHQFKIIEKTANRKAIFVEADFLRTNITHYIFHQNYFDLQMGLGLQMINYFPNLFLPTDTGKVWQDDYNSRNYSYKPRSIGINLNTSLGWQLSRNRLSYIYHSMGISSISIYESGYGDHILKGIGLSESFGMGTKYIFRQERADYNYTLGIEVKWSHIYMPSMDTPEGLSPIHGVDIRASGIFLTSGIQFGGKHTHGDIAYSQMRHNDFMSASASFQTFLDQETRHFRRKKAIKMLQYCQSQIPYQKVKLGIDAYLRSDFDEAIEWFYSADSDADKALKVEIQNNLQNIASDLLDSIENNKNEMSIVNAEKMAWLAEELHPASSRYSQVMAGLYMDKAKINTIIGNYSEAVKNYQKALQLYPLVEYIVMEKLLGIANLLMKDAYLSYQINEIYLVIKSIKDFIRLQPQMADELNPYILKLEFQIEENYTKKEKTDALQLIINKKHESLDLIESVLQLGMTFEETKNIQGIPQFIDKHTEKDQHFEMWTYPKGGDVSYLYFRNNILIRIEK